MTDKKTLLVAQVFIALMMAASMSGIMSLIALGPTMHWLSEWPKQFIIAWPIAFCLTLFVSRIAFRLALKLTIRTSR
ncbi:DUF2798 domain-containing protein [Mesorhizobium sp. LHD-90]|uniref:DUF2798 domain-containing protein n=1 Tax=Mesorhizobium sp. LHD-90 TaxID=3071414 RepID=UPI0027DFB7D1|nr:DUF2798 domain-containing protein [Mesorhizobium sp. LHD-90]MDQ6434816.1 DUF2798 domain-containing protein [Mesorhizobium sp. LHD-90]